MSVLRKMHDISNSPLDSVISWLLIGAIFFAIQSCEYLQTVAEEKKRTKIVRVGNIIFKKENRIIPHYSSNLELADLVRIKFSFQKNDKRNIFIHMFKSGDPILCPVIAWAKTVQQVHKMRNSSDDYEVGAIVGPRGGK